MEEREEKIYRPAASPPRIDIVSPEGYFLVQKLKIMASTCPKIAQPSPQIETLEEYKIAREYLNLSKQYGALLYAAAIGGCKDELVEQSQRVFTGVLSYIRALQEPSCERFQSEEDVKALEMIFYEVNYNIAQNHLSLLISMLAPATLQKDRRLINTHAQEIKRIKELISRNSKYRKLLQEELQNAQEMIPELSNLFSPQMNRQVQRPPRKQLKRIEQQKIINRHQKVSNRIPQGALDGLKDSFDLYFHCAVDKILTEILSLSSNQIKGEEYVKQLQNLTKEYRGLEDEGMRFKAKILGLETPSESAKLTPEDLTDLYKFFCKRFTLPQKNPIQLLEHMIVNFIHANDVEGALIRTEVLRNLLSEQGLLSDKFLAFRASVLALNGDPSEWRLILEEKKKNAAVERKQLRQQEVNRIKRHLIQHEKQQQKTQPEKQPQLNQTKKEARKVDTKSDSFDDHFSSPVTQQVPENVIRREKIKTRKPAQNPINEDKSGEKDTKDSSITSTTTQKDYPLSKNAFETYCKIRRGKGKFSRKDLYNLFEKLNCEVIVSQGKGDHGKIAPPLDMTVENKDGLVAVISEFTQKSNTSDIPLPLTVPNWDEKWDGRVPPYLMKSIVKALDYLGATDETVHKHNSSAAKTSEKKN